VWRERFENWRYCGRESRYKAKWQLACGSHGASIPIIGVEQQAFGAQQCTMFAAESEEPKTDDCS